jgi:hypothetical protein
VAAEQEVEASGATKMWLSWNCGEATTFPVRRRVPSCSGRRPAIRAARVDFPEPEGTFEHEPLAGVDHEFAVP